MIGRQTIIDYFGGHFARQGETSVDWAGQVSPTPLAQTRYDLNLAGIPTRDGRLSYENTLIVPTALYEPAKTIAADRYTLVGNPDFQLYDEQAAKEQAGNSIWRRNEFFMALQGVGLAIAGWVTGGLAASAWAAPTAATAVPAGSPTWSLAGPQTPFIFSQPGAVGYVAPGAWSLSNTVTSPYIFNQPGAAGYTGVDSSFLIGAAEQPHTPYIFNQPGAVGYTPPTGITDGGWLGTLKSFGAKVATSLGVQAAGEAIFDKGKDLATNTLIRELTDAVGLTDATGGSPQSPATRSPVSSTGGSGGGFGSYGGSGDPVEGAGLMGLSLSAWLMVVGGFLLLLVVLKRKR